MTKMLQAGLTARSRSAAALGLAAVALLVSSGLGFDTKAPETAPTPYVPSLSDVLPDKVPADLSEDEFDGLGDTWADWSQTTAGIVRDLYENEELSDSDRAELIKSLRLKLGVMEKALADIRYRKIHRSLETLYRRLARRVDMADALMAVVSTPPDAVPAELGAAVEAELRDAVDGVDALLGSVGNGDAWRGYVHLDALQTATTGGESGDMKELLGQVRRNLTEVDGLTPEQQMFVTRFPFQRLVAAIDDYIAYPEANDPGMLFAQHLAALVNAVEEYESSSRRGEADAVRRRQRTLLALAPAAAARVGKELEANYFNDNLHVSISESLLARLIRDHRDESGKVADCILGAWVTGRQVTSADVDVDIIRNDRAATFTLKLSGHTDTNTRGRKEPATIFTRGSHNFWVSKPISFDGEKFAMSPSSIQVDANNRTVGASTDYDWVPLFGGIARNIAVKEARKRKRQSEAIAAKKLTDQVLPKFDGEVAQRFNEANADLNRRLYAGLKRHDLYPSRVHSWSTDNNLEISTRTMDDVQIGGSIPAPVDAPSKGFVVQMHESLINNSLDRLPIAGRALSEEQLEAELETALTELLGREVDFKKPEDAGSEEADADTAEDTAAGEEAADDEGDSGGEPETTFVFDATDPLRVTFEQDQFHLVLRTGFRQEGKEEIPTQEIIVPITFELQGTTLVLDSGKPRIRPLTRVSRLKQLPRAAQINRILKAKLPRREMNVAFTMPVDETQRLDVALSEIVSTDGWLTMKVQ